MINVGLLFKIAGVGMIAIVMDRVLKSAGKDDYAIIANLAGIIMVLIIVVKLLNDLFSTVKTLFMF